MKNENDFWDIASNPQTQKKMDIIVKGAQEFAEHVKKLNNIEKVEVESYPFDTFTVLVHIKIANSQHHISLNLEDIRFRKIDFTAKRRIYAWDETEGSKWKEKDGSEWKEREGPRNFLYSKKNNYFLYDEDGSVITLTDSSVFDVFKSMYKKFKDISSKNNKNNLNWELKELPEQI